MKVHKQRVMEGLRFKQSVRRPCECTPDALGTGSKGADTAQDFLVVHGFKIDTHVVLRTLVVASNFALRRAAALESLGR